MIRKLFFAASVLSLLLCGIVLFLWVRSVYRPQWYDWSGTRETSLMNYCGQVDWYEAWWTDVTPSTSTQSPPVYFCHDLDPAVGLKERTDLLISLPNFRRIGPVAGIGVFWRRDGQFTEIMLPHWLLMLLFAAPPLAWLVRRARVRRAMRLGRCLHCGYDLRASNDRCPECGTPIGRRIIV